MRQGEATADARGPRRKSMLDRVQRISKQDVSFPNIVETNVRQDAV